MILEEARERAIRREEELKLEKEKEEAAAKEREQILLRYCFLRAR